MRAATLELQDEHTLIERAIPTLEWLSIRLESGTAVDDQLVADIIDFLGDFVENCHHRKEEALVFPILRGRGGDEAELAERLIEEHRKIERLLASLRESWDSGNIKESAEVLAALASLLRSHINVENSVAFAYVEMSLTDDDKDALVKQLLDFDNVTGSCSRERAETILESMIRQISAYA